MEARPSEARSIEDLFSREYVFESIEANDPLENALFEPPEDGSGSR